MTKRDIMALPLADAILATPPPYFVAGQEECSVRSIERTNCHGQLFSLSTFPWLKFAITSRLTVDINCVSGTKESYRVSLSTSISCQQRCSPTLPLTAFKRYVDTLHFFFFIFSFCIVFIARYILKLTFVSIRYKMHINLCVAIIT